MLKNDQVLELLLRYEELLEQGQAPTLEELCRDYPHLITEVRQRLQEIGTELENRTVEPPPALPPSAGDSLTPPDLLGQVKDHLQPPRSVVGLFTMAGRNAAPSGLPRIPGYEVLEELGRGGMGIVYVAKD